MSHEPTPLQLFWEAMAELPKLQAVPAPWKLAGSGVSVDIGSDLRARQEGGGRHDATARANARLIAAAPTLYNAAVEALSALVEMTDEHGRTDEQAETISILVEMIAWIHDDPRRGANLRDALDLEPLTGELAPKYAEPNKRGRQ